MAEINIGGELVPKTMAKKVAKAEYVYDPNQGGKRQNEINEELYQSKDVLPFDNIVASEIPAIAPITQDEPDEIIYSSFNKKFVAVVGSGSLQMYYYAWPGYKKYVDTDNNNAPYNSKVYLCGGKTYMWDSTDLVPGGGEQVQSDWNQTNTEAKDFIKNKPTIPTVPTNVSAFNNDAHYVDEQVLSRAIKGKANIVDVNTSLAQKADKTELETLSTQVDDRLDEQEHAIALLDGHDVVIVYDHTEVSNPDDQKIYREPNNVINPTSYTDWMYDNNDWRIIAIYTFPGVDIRPTKDSHNFVESGGLYNEFSPIKQKLANVDDVVADNDEEKIILSADSGKEVTSISAIEGTDGDEVVEFSSEHGSETYAKVGNVNGKKGLFVSNIFDLNGNPFGNFVLDTENDVLIIQNRKYKMIPYIENI